MTLRPETISLRLESTPPGAVLGYAGIDVTAPALRTRGGRVPPDRVGAGGARARRAALRLRSLVRRRRRLHEIVIPDGGPDADGGATGSCRADSAARRAPRAAARRRHAGALPRLGSRSTPRREASGARGGCSGRVVGAPRAAARRPRAAAAARREGLPLVAAAAAAG